MEDIDPLNQDVGVATTGEPHPDRPPAMPLPIPSAERLGQPHQVVTLFNSSRDQVHIVIDRHMRPHELAPGERHDGVEMLVEDVESFVHMRSPTRSPVLRYDAKTRRMQYMAPPPHPVIIEGIGDPAAALAKVEAARPKLGLPERR